MFFSFFNWASEFISSFSVFNYITLRAVLATLTSLFIGLIFGPIMIKFLSNLNLEQSVRNDGPQSHLKKEGTPTMGGALILVSLSITTILWADLSNRFIWITLIVTLGLGLVGFYDDYKKIALKNSKGLSAKWKFFWQSVIGFLAAVYLTFSVSASSNIEAWNLFLNWLSSNIFFLPEQSNLIVPFFYF